MKETIKTFNQFNGGIPLVDNLANCAHFIQANKVAQQVDELNLNPLTIGPLQEKPADLDNAIKIL